MKINESLRRLIVAMYDGKRVGCFQYCSVGTGSEGVSAFNNKVHMEKQCQHFQIRC